MSTGVSFQGGKNAGALGSPLISTGCRGQQWVDLHLHSPIRVHGMVLNWTQGHCLFENKVCTDKHVFPLGTCLRGRNANGHRADVTSSDGFLSVLWVWSNDSPMTGCADAIQQQLCDDVGPWSVVSLANWASPVRVFPRDRDIVLLPKRRLFVTCNSSTYKHSLHLTSRLSR
jgi:hypothetical protein